MREGKGRGTDERHSPTSRAGPGKRGWCSKVYVALVRYFTELDKTLVIPPSRSATSNHVDNKFRPGHRRSWGDIRAPPLIGRRGGFWAAPGVLGRVGRAREPNNVA
jgi:hypothetical protein